MYRGRETKTAAERVQLGVFLKSMIEGGVRAVRQGGGRKGREGEEMSVGGGEEEEEEEMEEEGERAIADAWAALVCLQCLR